MLPRAPELKYANVLGARREVHEGANGVDGEGRRQIGHRNDIEVLGGGGGLQEPERGWV